jgi:hypothetical protein
MYECQRIDVGANKNEPNLGDRVFMNLALPGLATFLFGLFGFLVSY